MRVRTLAAVVLIASLGQASAQEARIAGTVTGDGAPIVGAEVYVVPATTGDMPDPDGMPRALTGAKGEYEISGLRPGAYDVCARSGPYVPAIVGVTLSARQ